MFVCQFVWCLCDVWCFYCGFHPALELDYLFNVEHNIVINEKTNDTTKFNNRFFRPYNVMKVKKSV